MEIAEHTPGPWFWHGPINRNRRDFGVTAGRAYDPSTGAVRRIAWVGNAAYISQGKARADEVEANARLIAAAPDMLEALQACATILPHYHMRGETTGHDEAHHAVLEQVQEAIALATGKGGGFGQGRR